MKSRLTAEIQYWDFRAADLKEKENAGKVNAKLNSDNAHRKAEELEARMNRRLAEIEKEKAVSAAPPIIVGGALVMPKGLLQKLTASETTNMFGSGDRKAVELAAMKAVTDIENSLGFIPKDVSAQNVGYDIESEIPEDKRNCTESSIRFIEVKGRTKGADTVTVTKNEILTALNKPESYILAMVEVDGDCTKTVYLRCPFSVKPDFATTGITYNINELIGSSEVLLER